MATDSASDDNQWQWIMEAHMDGPEFLNDEMHVAIVCKSKELEGRPHELACLASQGILQHHFNKAALLRSPGWSSSAGVRNDAELKPGEVEDIHERINTTSW